MTTITKIPSSLVKRGLQFQHARVIDPDTRESLLYVVTRVASGVVYYRPVTGGGAQCSTLLDFPRWVLRLVDRDLLADAMYPEGWDEEVVRAGCSPELPHESE